VDVSGVVEGLRARLDGERVRDEALRLTAVRRYNLRYGDQPEDWEEYGLPAGAQIHVRFTPLSEDERSALRAIDALLNARWGQGLPAAFVELYERFGVLKVAIEGGGENGFWSPRLMLTSTELQHPAWEAALPRGGNQTAWKPFLRFLGTGDEGEATALIFRCTDEACPGVCLGRPWSEDFESDLEHGMLVHTGQGPYGSDFLDWFSRWIEAGLDLQGSPGD
jgi:hypothetical protein